MRSWCHFLIVLSDTISEISSASLHWTVFLPDNTTTYSFSIAKLGEQPGSPEGETCVASVGPATYEIGLFLSQTWQSLGFSM